MTRALLGVLATIDGWGAGHAAASVVGPDGPLATYGDPDHSYRWASVTKPVTALSILVAAERGLIDLDEAAGPPDSTVRHLLAHTSGLPFEGDVPLSLPGRRRIYSNPGFDRLGELLATRAGVPFATVLAETILAPLGMGSTELLERPSQGLHGPLRDLAAFARELLRPTLLSEQALSTATSVAFRGLPGVVPGVGRFDPCDWGLGVEIHDGKAPHWMGERLSPRAFGHFGGSGTFLWVDPEADVALVVLTDRDFGPWALQVWPPFSDEVHAAVTAGRS